MNLLPMISWCGVTPLFYAAQFLFHVVVPLCLDTMFSMQSHLQVICHEPVNAKLLQLTHSS